METTKLIDADHFVEIIDGPRVYYGGSQAWFDFTVGKYGGCSTVAVANVAAYLASQDAKYSRLFNCRSSNCTAWKITKFDFKGHMTEVYQYIKPMKFPGVDKNRPALKVGKDYFGWTFGLWSVSTLAKGFQTFARFRGIKLRLWYCTGKGDRESIIRFIQEGLSQNSPVLLLIGFNSRMKNCLIYSYSGKWTHSCSRHWVTITELREDKVSGKTEVKVSTWGGYSFLDLKDLMGDKGLHRRIVFFT